jgi:hypothetical protein
VSLKAYNRLDVVGVEVLAGDPGANVFTGRTYYNSSTDEFRVYNGSLWIAFGSSGFSPYIKRVGPGEAYTTLAAVAAVVDPDDWILVTGDTTDTADVDISADDVAIEWAPGATSTFNGGAHSSILQLTGQRIRLVKPNISFAPSAGVTDGLLIAAVDCQVIGGRFATGSAQTFTNMVRITSSYAIVQAILKNTSGATITNNVNDGGTNLVQVVGP